MTVNNEFMNIDAHRSAMPATGGELVSSVAKKVEVAVAAIVAGDAGSQRILITKRPAGTHLAGFWELPGGKIRCGESAQEAARREVREEVGLVVGAFEPLVTVEHDYEDRHVRLHALIAWQESCGVINAADVEHRWIPVGELAEVAFPAANVPVTAAILERIKAGEC